MNFHMYCVLFLYLDLLRELSTELKKFHSLKFILFYHFGLFTSFWMLLVINLCWHIVSFWFFLLVVNRLIWQTGGYFTVIPKSLEKVKICRNKCVQEVKVFFGYSKNLFPYFNDAWTRFTITNTTESYG